MQKENTPFLEIRNLTYQYSDGTKALIGIDLDIQQGEKLVVIGPNGSGKSTLFLCLNGVLKAKHGSILLQGQPLSYDRKGLIETRKKIGIVFQDPETQLFCINVFQEVAFGPANLGLKKEALQHCVEQTLAKMNLTALQDRPPHFLSGGQKKQVSIASVVAMNPELMIFDEPTAALDAENMRQTMDLMEELNQNGITMMMSTHDMELAYEWADRVAVLKDGTILRIGTPQEIFTNKELLQQVNLAPPKLLQFYEQLVRHRVLPNTIKPPKSMEELEVYLENKHNIC